MTALNPGARATQAPGHTVIPAIAADGTLFPMEKLDVHRRAQLHLAVSVFVFDGPLLLIQRRACGKYHCGGLWANTCCSHPLWGEALAAGASRRLREELGFTLPLAERCTVEYSADVGSGLHEHERVTVFVAQARKDELMVDPDPLEVEETRWISWPELAAEMARDPGAFAPWFRIYAERFPGFAFPTD